MIALLATPGIAAADPPPPCYGASCNGKDAQSIGCAGSNAYSIGSFTFSGVIVTLRYSDWCHSNWATASSPGGGIAFFVENTSGDSQMGGTNSYGWTKMVNGVPLARACIPVGETKADYPCTGWH